MMYPPNLGKVCLTSRTRNKIVNAGVYKASYTLQGRRWQIPGMKYFTTP